MRHRRWAAVALVTAALVVVAGVAWAASLAVSSQSLGGATLTTPAFYPTIVTTGNVNKGTLGRLEKGDVIQVTYNRVLQNSSLCAGAAQGTFAAAGFVFTLTNGGAANDTLSISGGTSCAALHFGSFTLGSTAYTTGTLTYTASTIAVVPGATTTQITLTIGTGTASSTVNTATVLKYTPDPLITDTTPRSIGTNTATTASGVQF